MRFRTLILAGETMDNTTKKGHDMREGTKAFSFHQLSSVLFDPLNICILDIVDPATN